MKKISSVILILLLVVFSGVTGGLIVPHASYAAKVTAVMGLIENVSHDSLVVLGKRYMIAGVPLIDLSGKPVPRAQLTIGTKVTIYFENRNLLKILVHPDMPK